MKGELIILRAYGGQPLIRRIWEITDKAIYVTDDLRKGIVSVGFPRADIFKYDPTLVESMEQLYKQGKWSWQELTNFEVRPNEKKEQ